MASVELVGVRVRRGGDDILRGVDLRIDDGELVAVVGVTGSGKTTLLRVVAGLDRPSAGAVLVDGVDVTARPPDERDLAFVFQRPALYPHRSVRGNLSFPLELRHEERAQIRERVGAEARAFHLEALLDRPPDELSDGEAHAVQVARAVVRQPALLLLDEPFAGIDDARSDQLRRELRLLRTGLGITTLQATNDAFDAMTADRVAVIEAGRISQIGPPLEVYRHPMTAAAAALTGDADLVEVHVTADPAGNGWWLEHPGLRVHAWQPGLAAHVGRRLQLVSRPDWWQVDDHGSIRLTVDRVWRLGATTTLACRVGSDRLSVRVEADERIEPRSGDTVTARLEHYVLLDPRDGYPVRLDRD